jgi:arsenate reductase
LRERDVEFDVIEYLKQPASRKQLEQILDQLPDPPGELVRKDKNFKTLGLDAGDYESREAVVSLLLEHPKLMQRPIVVAGDRAAIGRPPENVLPLLD